MSRTDKVKELTRGEQVKVMRDTAGLTQEEFAARAGVSATAVSDWETGKHEPSNRHWRAVCKMELRD